MEKFCQSINAAFMDEQRCSQYFYQMIAACLKQIKNQATNNNLWRHIKRFIFPRKEKGLNSLIAPADIQSQELHVKTCVRMLSDYVFDYTVRTPRYQNEKQFGILLWTAMWLTVGLIILLIFSITVKFIHWNLNKAYTKSDDEEDIESVELPRVCNLRTRTMAAVNRSLRITREELRRLRVMHLVQSEEILAPDGISVLVLKVGSQVQLLDNHLIGKMRTFGRLYRLQNQHVQYRYEFQKILLHAALHSLAEKMQRMHFLIEFEEDCIYDELIWTNTSDTVSTVRRKSTLCSPGTSTALGRKYLPESSALLRKAQSPKGFVAPKTIPPSSSVKRSRRKTT
uniref:Uncharacterized protein n=1 Tax=Glossina austeni TaxID=7395 RepID=A0A1A9VN36_GLOAU